MDNEESIRNIVQKKGQDVKKVQGNINDLPLSNHHISSNEMEDMEEIIRRGLGIDPETSTGKHKNPISSDIEDLPIDTILKSIDESQIRTKKAQEEIEVLDEEINSLMETILN